MVSKVVTLLAAAALAAGLGGYGAADEAAPPKEGDKAPPFTLTGTDGKQYSLKDFAGKSAVVLAWYPKALTGG